MGLAISQGPVPVSIVVNEDTFSIKAVVTGRRIFSCGTAYAVDKISNLWTLSESSNLEKYEVEGESIS